MTGLELRLSEGRARLGERFIEIAAAGPDGRLEVGGGAGVVVRPLLFGERARLVRYALSTPDPVEELIATLLAAATVDSGDGTRDTALAGCVAFHLAGASSGGFGFAAEVSLLARALGWSPVDIAAAMATEVDALAIAWRDVEATDPGGGWTRVVIADRGAGKVDSDPADLLRAMAVDLLDRGRAPLDRAMLSEIGGGRADPAVPERFDSPDAVRDTSAGPPASRGGARGLSDSLTDAFADPLLDQAMSWAAARGFADTDQLDANTDRTDASWAPAGRLDAARAAEPYPADRVGAPVLAPSELARYAGVEPGGAAASLRRSEAAIGHPSAPVAGGAAGGFASAGARSRSPDPRPGKTEIGNSIARPRSWTPRLVPSLGAGLAPGPIGLTARPGSLPRPVPAPEMPQPAMGAEADAESRDLEDLADALHGIADLRGVER